MSEQSPSEEPLVGPNLLEAAVALAAAFRDLATEDNIREITEPFSRFHFQLVGVVRDAAIDSEHSLEELAQECARQVSTGSWSVDLTIIDSSSPYSISTPGHFQGVHSAVEWTESLLPTSNLFGSTRLLEFLKEARGRTPVHPASALMGFVLLHEDPHSILPKMELRQSSMHRSW